MNKNLPIQHVFQHYERSGQPASVFTFCPHCGQALKTERGDQPPRPTCTSCGFVQYRNPAPAISILIVSGGQIVLGKRRGEPGKGTWALPSGYIDYDEDFLTAAVREAKEETGLDVAIQSILNVSSSFVSPSYHFLGIYVLASVKGGALAAGDDLEAAEWRSLSNPLPNMGFEEDVKIIELQRSGFTGIPVGPGENGIYR